MLLEDWLEANTQTVANSYPQFQTAAPPVGSTATRAWKGVIAPLKGSEELGYILDDLANGAVVLVQAGTLSHDPSCRRTHQRPGYLESLKAVDSSFAISLLVFPPKHHPKAFCLTPEITKRIFPLHPHLHADNAVCSYQPNDRVLPWDDTTVTVFLNYTSIWLAKHIVWQQTGANQNAIWIGPAAGHTIQEILRDVGRNDPCPCGSGAKFKNCHLTYCEQQNAAMMAGPYIRRF